jgi:hypothetical protein
VVVDTTRLFVKTLDVHLVVAFVEEVHQGADLDVMVAGELLRAVEQNLHRPSAEIVACFPQGHRGRLPVGEKLGERVRELLLAERAVVDEDDELEVLVAGSILFLT